MDLQAKKIQFIQEVLRLKNEEIIDKLGKILHQEKKKIAQQKLSPMTMEEFNALIDQVEKGSENNSLYNVGDSRRPERI